MLRKILRETFLIKRLDEVLSWEKYASIFKHFCIRFCLFIFIFLKIFSPVGASAQSGVYKHVRATGYDNGRKMCDTGTIAFKPFSTNQDFNFIMSNPSCIGYAAGAGAAMIAAFVTSWALCRTPTNSFGVMAEQSSSGEDAMIGPALPFPEPGWLHKMAATSAKCGARIGESFYTGSFCGIPDPTAVSQLICSQNPLAFTDAQKCCISNTAFLAAVGVAVSALALIWDQSRIAYENNRICGHDWYAWTKEPQEISAAQAELEELRKHNNPNYSPPEPKWRKIGGYKKCLDDLFKRNNNSCGLSYNGSTDVLEAGKKEIKNQLYREYIYGGREYADSSSGSMIGIAKQIGCSNPSTWGSAKRMQILGYDSDVQRYYMTGPASTPVFACTRFLSHIENEEDRVATKEAFECCKQRSQSTMCIEARRGFGGILGPYEYKFCKFGTMCKVADVTYEIFPARTKSDYICAKTYTVCPYDHLLGGGTEFPDVNQKDMSLWNNFCQVMNHCVRIPILPKVRMSNFTGAFISDACFDLRGDSQNVYGYSSQIMPINNKSFSAGIVQCYKETLENLFLHVAGRSECKNPEDVPDNEGVCPGGISENLYVKGEALTGKSFFMKIQDKLRSAIQMVLILSVTFMGVNIFFGVQNLPLKREQITMYVIKLGLVMFFAMGNGWKVVFFDNILSFSQATAELVFTPGLEKYQVMVGDKYYSCVDRNVGLGGRHCAAEPASSELLLEASKLDGCQFPRYDYSADPNSDDKYLTPRYPPGKSYLKIFDILDCKLGYALGFGPEVSVPNLVMMMLGGFLIGFLGALFFVLGFFFAFMMLSVVLRTMHIFLMSITATVILLYVSPITICCAMFERTKSIFGNWLKHLISYNVQLILLFAYLGIFLAVFDRVVLGEDVVFRGDGIENPKTVVCQGEAANKSLYCIFSYSNFSNFDGLNIIGITMPILLNMSKEKIATIFVSVIILAIFSFMIDQIPTVSEQLFGAGLNDTVDSAWKSSAIDMTKKSFEVVNAVRERGQQGVMRPALNKVGGGIASTVGNIRKHGLKEGLARTAASAIGGNIPEGKTPHGGTDIESLHKEMAQRTHGGSDHAASSGSGGAKSAETPDAPKDKSDEKPPAEKKDSPKSDPPPSGGGDSAV